tara:strand:- start:8332 stop:12615 length:4284 start_codon:yes stop_codon:yes gene_type:complete
MEDTDKITWKIIDKLFKDIPNLLVKHHIDSYNIFFNKKIYNIFREKNPIKIFKDENPDTKTYNYQAEIFFGGKNGDRLHFGKPIIFDESREHYMYPNEARLRNMTYATTLHIDIEVFFKIIKDTGETLEHAITFDKIYFGKFPIMLQSDLCILNTLPRETRFTLGECKNDLGGYFIIDGKEKVIISQEKFADNMIYIKDDYSEIYSHTCEIKSVSEDSSKPVRTLSIRIVRPNDKFTYNNIVVNIPNVRKPVPLFIVMRALGIESDYDIINHCLLDLEQYSDYVDLFIPSVHDAGNIYNQEVAIKYISTLTKNKTVPHTLYILSDYLLPHIGEINFTDKAFFIGHMVFELLKVLKNVKKPTDRDSFKYKRVELTGELIYGLFKEYYTLQQKHIFQKIDKEYYYKQGIYQDINFISLIENNSNEIFKDRILESGFKKAFKGSWGAEEHTRRPEVIQDLNRLSFNSFMSHLRKINLPLDSSAKVIGPRLLHSSQWGIIDPVDTPDGGNVGLHKHLAISAHITSGYSREPMIDFLKSVVFMEPLEQVTIKNISKMTKIFVNGCWCGVISVPVTTMEILINSRRLGLIPVYTSISWDKTSNIIIIYTDSGRICRPVFYIKDGEPSYKINSVLSKLTDNEDKYHYYNLLVGFNRFNKDINIEKFIQRQDIYYNTSEIYNKSEKLPDLLEKPGIIEYLDTAESETSLIVTRAYNITNKTSHLEIHGSLLLGVMGNQIVFPENNQLPRDLFSCGQSKQGVSLYSSNYQNRIDKMGVVLNNGQVPLVKSRYLKYIYNEEHPYGINAIVAIGCYGSYNVEDSILFNEGSVKRGMFNTTYFNMYEAREQSEKIKDSLVSQKFANIESENVIGKKPGYDYHYLNKNGLIKENTELNDKLAIIGKISTNLKNPETFLDSSIYPKKGQLGFVDKAFITDGEEGFRIAKVRIREERIPAIGDKFCSRCGQKGTVGLLIPEQDMPYTSEGLRPDLIINPHALPSRMTIGQLVETLMGKACSILGGFGDCTAFQNDGPKHEIFGNILRSLNYSSSGNEIFYSGETGEQLNMELFVGPCYYMRLKHMVKDKINYRARGPRTVLTRQTVQGRANDGGLRVGEMERDGIIAHGASYFLKESMLVRGDDYYVAVCNNTGAIAIYNREKNIFLSPFIDGPIKFNEDIDKTKKIEVISKYGRSFSRIRVPYSFKLLIQELQIMNVQMHIITDKNINNFKSMNLESSIELYKKLEYITKQDIENNINLSSDKQDKLDTIVDDKDKDKDDNVDDDKDADVEQDDSDNDSNSGLSQVTIDSIKKANKEALEMEEDDELEGDDQIINPINIGSEDIELSGVEDIGPDKQLQAPKEDVNKPIVEQQIQQQPEEGAVEDKKSVTINPLENSSQKLYKTDSNILEVDTPVKSSVNSDINLDNDSDSKQGIKTVKIE